MTSENPWRAVWPGLFVMAFVLATSGAFAATVTGATADGSTSISSVCTVSLSSTIPQTLNVADNDTVETVYRVSWSDTRPANSSSVTSAFSVKVWYPSDTTMPESESHSAVTTGATSGSTTLRVYTEGVTEGTEMKIQFDVSVSGWLGCGPLDWDQGTITFG